MEKKEFKRHAVSHFQQPGQAYFITWSLQGAVSPEALADYTKQLSMSHSKIVYASCNRLADSVIRDFKMQYDQVQTKYTKAYDDLLHMQSKPVVNLANEANRAILFDTLSFWEGKKLKNYAFCIMSNHVHWVFRLLDKDGLGNTINLQDILPSVMRFSATAINRVTGFKGSLWGNESLDTTIRDDEHLYNAIKYTLNNPVGAGLVRDWSDWDGTRLFDELEDIY
jgi:REP element-mobilizing transposase RayT